MKYLLSLLFLSIPFFSSAVTQAQNTLWGTVQDKATGQRMAGVNILVKGSVVGTVTDNKGQFSLQTNQALPLTLAFSAIGYQKQEIVISTGAQAINLALAPQTTLMQEVVVAASRVEESSLKAPVTIEKMDVRAIRETSSFTFYDALQHVKSLDLVTSGLTYKAINTRGFAGTGNSRFLQLVDGVDNQTPGLNFAVGNLFGLSDLDAESVELIPGSASALYGPVAFNGVLVMRSKNPFQYQGLSVTGKLGVNHVNDPNTAAAPLYDVGLRYAQALTPRLAFKVNASYLRGLDWFATNYRDIDTKTPVEGRGDHNPGRNALNQYGDEVAQTLPGIGRVSRTGYEERYLSDYHVHSLKLNGTLHYRLTDKVEAIYQYNYGLGTANYTGSSRFSINNFTLQQHRAELRGSRFFVRAYTTIEHSHDSYNARTLGQQLNKTWVRDLDGNAVSPDQADQTWFARYAAAYQGKADGVTPGDHAVARNFADEGRYLPGTPDFDREKNRLAALYGGATGAGIFSN
ncbi:MAG: carboxypeptidase-like regulatory domain-containing protein, partial [Cytophagales bacterium]|nr:carboxypeptidase-like regulatory domain-containing protein [Cytophagales bacterium]